jgi:hypothetical protein
VDTRPDGSFPTMEGVGGGSLLVFGKNADWRAEIAHRGPQRPRTADPGDVAGWSMVGGCTRPTERSRRDDGTGDGRRAFPSVIGPGFSIRIERDAADKSFNPGPTPYVHSINSIPHLKRNSAVPS